MAALRGVLAVQLNCMRCSLVEEPPAIPVGTRSYDPRAVATTCLNENATELIIVVHWQGCPQLDQALRALPRPPQPVRVSSVRTLDRVCMIPDCGCDGDAHL